MNRFFLVSILTLAAFCGFSEEARLQQAKLELLVEQAGEMLADANRKGSETHNATFQYYFGLVYGSGTNLLARKDSVLTRNLRRRYIEMVEKNYEAYTKVENAIEKASATGSDTVCSGRHVVKNGTRHRAKRIANAEKLGDAELIKAIKQWESFATQLFKSR